MNHSRIRSIAGVGLAVLLVAGPLAGPAAASSKALQGALEVLKAGGQTIAGPGTFTAAAPGVAGTVASLGADSNVCATVTVVSGDAIVIELRDGASVLLATGTTSATTKTLTVCVDGSRFVQLACSGALPCVAAWRVDGKL